MEWIEAPTTVGELRALITKVAVGLHCTDREALRTVDQADIRNDIRGRLLPFVLTMLRTDTLAPILDDVRAGRLEVRTVEVTTSGGFWENGDHTRQIPKRGDPWQGGDGKHRYEPEDTRPYRYSRNDV